MTWPSSDVPTTGMDAGNDTPPRSVFMAWAAAFNQLRNHVTGYMQGLLASADQAAARASLDVPSRAGGNASGTWGISISGNAATATTAGNVNRSVTGSGLASGGGLLDANRTISVPKATQAQAEAGADDATAMTPLSTAQAITARAPAIGVGQTWQNVQASRVDDTPYQNTTGKPIMVNVSQDDLSGTNRMYAYVSIDNSTWILVETSMSSESTRGSVGFIVPSGHYYRVNTSTTIVAWAELR